ncbi:TraB/GumN family protein [Erythrobacteraceae bacterium E2-1 Yellow Sea]|nr:TraB/GumN family protein [Erythrobacteraceae bacterium E2-1 Yellow Sea]
MWLKRLMLGMGLALSATACSDAPGGDGARPSPMLYEIADTEGQPVGWMFGTIHSLPAGTQWRTPALEHVMERAGVLVVEIAALDDQAALRQTFSDLATTPAQPDIGMRVPSSSRPALFNLIEKSGLSASDFGATETWAAALILAQVDDDGGAANGADRALLRDFANRQVREFEGAEKQLGIFDTLPEGEQRDMLMAVVEEADQHNKDTEKLRHAWLAGDAEVLEDATQKGLLADPELRAALLIGRNTDWLQQLLPMLEAGDRPLVAVGTAHLIGPDGLAAMLEARGYSVKRLQ